MLVEDIWWAPVGTGKAGKRSFEECVAATNGNSGREKPLD